jgi:hypothetical protein
VFVFATDGVHEFVNTRIMINAINDHGSDLDAARKADRARSILIGAVRTT